MKPKALAAALLLVLSVSPLADDYAPPLLEFSSGLPGTQVRLAWPSEAGLRYRIEKSATLQNDGPGGWKQIALVEATGNEAEWLDPEPTTQKAFYRVSRPLPEVFSVEPPLLSETGGIILLHGQRLGGGFLTLEIEGSGTVSAPLTPAGDGVWRAVFSGQFPADALVLSATVTDASGVPLVVIGQPITITPTGRAHDGPASLPPAAPVPDAQSNPIPGVGIVVKRNKPSSTKRIFPGGGPGDDGDGFFNTRAQDHNSSRSNESSSRGSAVSSSGGSGGSRAEGADYNSSRSNKSQGIAPPPPPPVPPLTAVAGVDVAIKEKGTGADSQRIVPSASGLPGEVSFHSIDLALAAPAGPSLAWVRTYRSIAPLSSGHGPGWDFSYNISIEPIPASAGAAALRLRVHDGGGRADILHRQPDGSYTADGLFREGRFDGGVFTLTFADQGKWIFRPLDGSPASGKIASISDSHDVSLSCDYDAATGLLKSVSDAFGRSLAVTWDAGRIVSVADFTGRSVDFQYHQQGEPGGSPGTLKSASAPAAPGLPPVAGPTAYTYTTGSLDERLNHNLLSITDGAGRLLEAFTYSPQADPLAVDYDTLATHDRHGDQVVTLHLELLPNGHTLLIENDELGRVSEAVLDRLHRPVSVREHTGFATPGQPVTSSTNRPNPASKLRSADPDFYETTFAYNADHHITRCQLPPGTGIRATWQRDLDPRSPARERGNLRTLTLLAPGGEARTVSMEHLPGFGTPESARPGNPIGGLTIKGGRNPGGDLSNNASRGNPLYEGSGSGGESPFYEGMVAGNGSGPRDAASGLPTGKRQHKPVRLSPRDAASGLPTGKRQHKPVSLSPRDSASGLPTGKRQHKPVSFSPRDAASGLPTGKRQHKPVRLVTAHGQTFTWTYNERGDATGGTTPIPGEGFAAEYNALGQPVSFILLDGPGSSFHTAYHYDPATHFPSSVVHDPEGLAITTSCDHDDLGRVTRITDPLGHEWLCEYNALDIPVHVQSPESPTRISWRATYDLSGRLVREDFAHLDPSGKPDPANPAYTTFHVLDHRARLVRTAAEERPVDAQPGVTDPAALGIENFAVLDIVRDDAGQIVRLSTPGTSRGSGEDQDCDFTYDERGLLHRIIDGGTGNPSAVTTEYDYDSLGALTREALVAPGLPAPENLYTYDGFHRLSSATDALGNIATFAYDNQGFVTTSLYGELDDGPGSAGNVLLARTISSQVNDPNSPLRASPLGRIRGEIPAELVRSLESSLLTKRSHPDFLWLPTGSSTFLDVFTKDDIILEERFDPAATTPSFVTETTILQRSPAGLPLSLTRNGETLLTVEYDTLGRPFRCHDGSCRSERTLDPAGNTISSIRTDFSTLGGVPPKTFTTTFDYDALGRCIQTTDGAGNTVSTAWDSLGRPVTVTEPGGLVLHHAYDGVDSVGAPFSHRLSADVDGDGIPETLSSSLVRGGELLSETNSHGDAHTYTYDTLGRFVRCDRPDGTHESIAHDDSRGIATGKRLPDGSLLTLTYDANLRVTSTTWTDLPSSSVPVPDTTFAHDGLGRPVQVQQGDSTVSFAHDSLDNPIAETSDGHTITRSFDHRGRTGITYPDGTRFVENRDALGRLLAVSSTDAVGAPVSPPLVALDYLGHRVFRETRANGVVTETTFRGDGNPPSGPGDLSFDAAVQITTRDSLGNSLSATTLLRDANQRLTGSATTFGSAPQAPPGRIQTFTRDALGRVTACFTRHREVPGAPFIESEVTYTLDLEGRRLTATGGENPGAYIQDHNIPPGDRQMGRYTHWPRGPLTWDPNGNLTTFLTATGPRSFTYDAEGRLASSFDPATNTTTGFTYDALGRPSTLSRSSGQGLPPAVTRFVHDGPACIQELDGDGLPLLTFTRADGPISLISPATGDALHAHGNEYCGETGHLLPVTTPEGTVLEHIASDDAGKPVFLDGGGRIRQAATSLSGLRHIGPVRWMAPESLWEPSTGLFHGGAGTYSPDLGTTTSSAKAQDHNSSRSNNY